MFVKDIRNIFMEKLFNKEFIIDKTGVKTIEILAADFIADEPFIFGKPNQDYIERELTWYNSQSLNVNDIPPPIPVIWQKVATPDGRINSNYGWAVYSEENFNQYKSCFAELSRNPDSRRGVMLYTRPSMQVEYNKDGMSDFMCTFATHHLIRDGKLQTIMMMRSNDAWAGYRSDFGWVEHIHKKLATELNIKLGNIYWKANSLHIYEKQFYLVEHYTKTGEAHITKEDYDKLYNN